MPLSIAANPGVWSSIWPAVSQAGSAIAPYATAIAPHAFQWWATRGAREGAEEAAQGQAEIANLLGSIMAQQWAMQQPLASGAYQRIAERLDQPTRTLSPGERPPAPPQLRRRELRAPMMRTVQAANQPGTAQLPMAYNRFPELAAALAGQLGGGR